MNGINQRILQSSDNLHYRLNLLKSENDLNHTQTFRSYLTKNKCLVIKINLLMARKTIKHLVGKTKMLLKCHSRWSNLHHAQMDLVVYHPKYAGVSKMFTSQGWGSDIERESSSLMSGPLRLLQLEWNLNRPLACTRQITSAVEGRGRYSLILTV
jgi:hypothetical protein